MNSKIRNAYTDAPECHPNLILGSVQLLFWLFFHPSAWRNYVTRLDPTLLPDFALAELSQAQWQDPAWRRLLLMIYLVSPLLVSLLSGLVLWLVGEPDHIRFGMASSAVFCFAFSVWVGIARGVALGYAGGVAGSIAGGVASFAIAYSTDGTVEGGRGAGLAFAVATSVAGSVAISMASQKSLYSFARFARQIGGMVIGVGVGSVLGGVAFETAFWVADSVSSVYNLVWGLLFGGVLACVLSVAIGVVVWWRTLKWRRGVAVGALVMLFSVTMGGAGGAAFNVANGATSFGVVHDMAIGAVGGSASGILFVLSYVLAERLAGSWAGAVAGALMGGGIYLAISIANTYDYSPWVDLPLSLMSILLGLGQAWWRPVLLYPFLAAWNTLLYRADERRSLDREAGTLARPTGTPARLTLLRWHSAFWDQEQRLPLLGLEDHLILVMERKPLEGQAALEYLASSHQRWAAQAAQIELDARQLERYLDVAAISRAHRHLAAFSYSSSNSALLRSISRISQDVEAALQQTSSYNQRLALSAVLERLDGLLRELTRSSEQYAVRFRPIVTSWHQIVADQVRSVAEAAEQSQEIDNPYVFGVPLTEKEEIFVGRTDISARLEQLLLDRRRPPLLLVGQRRMGKTSLLRNLGRLLPSSIVPLFVDGERVAGASDIADYLYNIASQMSKSALRQRNLSWPPLNREALAAHPFTSFNEWLDQVEQSLEAAGPHMALLALDEFEALLSVLNKERFDETDLLRMLRHLIQHRPRFKVLLSGSHMLSEYKRWASYLINVQVVKISYLHEEEARQLIEDPMQDFRLRYEPDATQRVLSLTRGYPHLVQLLCYEIVELKNSHPPAKRRLALYTDVEAAAQKALYTGSFFFADIEQNQVDERAVAVLRFLAAQGEGARVDQDSLTRHFPDKLQQTLELLLRRDLIEPVHGGYRFQVELIRRWFARPDQVSFYQPPPT